MIRRSIIAVVLLAAALPAHGSNWKKLFGPFVGSVRAVKLHPGNENILLAMTRDRIYKSTNAGRHWRIVLTSRSPLYVLEVAPSDPDVIYTNGFRSSDGGETWSPVDPIPFYRTEWAIDGPDDVGNELAVHPADPRILFAGFSSDGLHRSLDGGNRWQLVPAGPRGLVLYDRTTPSRLFVFSVDSLHESLDAGNTWNTIGPLPDAGSLQPKQAFYDSGNLYLLVGQDANGMLEGRKLYISRDSGGSWQALSLTAADDGFKRINAFHGNGGFLYAVTDGGGFRSADAGATWMRITPGRDALAAIDVRSRVITGSENLGVSLASFSADDWTNVGLDPVDLSAAEFVTTRNGGVYLNTASAIYRLNADTSGWHAVQPAAAGTAVLAAAAASDDLFAIVEDSVFVRRTGSEHWAALGRLPERPRTGFAVSDDGMKQFFAGAEGNLVRSVDGGASWRLVALPGLTALQELHYSRRDILYARSESQFFISQNDGLDWRPMQDGLPELESATGPFAVDPADTDRLFARAGGTVYEKRTGAQSWSAFYPGGALVYPKPAQRFAISPRQADVYYGVMDPWFHGAPALVRWGGSAGNWQPIDSGFDALGFESFTISRTAPHPMFHMQLDGSIWMSSLDSLRALTNFPTARLQVIHNAADPAISQIDIYLDGEILLDNLSFRSATADFQVPADRQLNLQIAVSTSQSAADAFKTATLSVQAEQREILVLSGVREPARFAGNPDALETSLQALVIEDARTVASAAGKMEFLFQNGVTDAPKLDLLARDLLKLTSNVSFGGISEYLTLSPGKYTLDLAPSADDSARVGSFSADLGGRQNSAALMFTSGFLDPAANQGGVGLALLAAFPDGSVVQFANLGAPSGKPGRVELVEPPFATVDVSTRPVLRWLPIQGASQYRIQIDSHPSFRSVVIDQIVTGNNELALNGLAEKQAYYWRVRADNDVGTGEWSRIWRFTTRGIDAKPAAPVLASPEDAAGGIATDATLSWYVVDGAGSYDLELASNESYSPAIFFQSLIDTFLTVQSLQHDSTYFWRVRASNNAGLSKWSESRRFRTLEVDNLTELPMQLLPRDSADHVSVEVELRWRMTPSATTYSLEIATNPGFSPAVFYAAISDTFKTLTSLSYGKTYFWRVRAENTFQKTDWTSAFQFRTLPPYPDSLFVAASLYEPPPAGMMPDDGTAYRLIGLPGNSAVPIADVMPGARGEDWLAFRDTGAETDYLVGDTPEDPLTFGGGKAFWLISRQPVTIVKDVMSVALDSAGSVQIPLQPGWNLLTNPFLRAIPWSLVQAHAGVTQPIWKFEGGFEQSAELAPYRGYYFLNDQDLTALHLPYTLTASNLTVPEKSPEPGWRVHATPELEGTGSTTATFGESVGATQGKDAFDLLKPRTVVSAPGVHFSLIEGGRERTALTDIREAGRSGNSWRLHLSTASDRPIRLRLDGIAAVPADYLLLVSQAGNGTATPIRSDTTLKVIPQEGQAVLRLETVLANEYQALALPVTFRLGQNYPNPFNPETRIPLYLHAEAEVVLAVYDLRGRRIRVLHQGPLRAGSHTATWDGQNASGQQMASGVYLYRLTAAGQRSEGKMVLVR